MLIRLYTETTDYPEVCRWSKHYLGIIPEPTQMSETSYVVEHLGIPVAVISIMLTNAKTYCIAECLFTNPDVPIRVRKKAMEKLLAYAEAFAKALQYKGLFCWTDSKKMVRHYQKMGFKVGFPSAVTLYKRIGG